MMPSTGVGDPLQLVEGILHTVGDVQPPKHMLGGMLSGEVLQLGPHPTGELIPVAFQDVDRIRVQGQVLGVGLPEPTHALGGPLRRPDQHLGLRNHARERLADPVQEDQITDLLDLVGDIIQSVGRA
jgi:hypothetical protein